MGCLVMAVKSGYDQLMEGRPIYDGQTPQNFIGEELVEVIKSDSANVGELGKLDGKLEVLKKLPNNLVEQLQAHLQAQQIEDQKRGKEEGDQHKLIMGRLFEILCEIEFGAGQSPAGSELCGVLNDPDICGLGVEVGRRYRNPDLTYVETDETGAVQVKAIAEAKMGELDYRSFSQLSVGGIRSGLKRVVEVLNKYNLRKLGFKHLNRDKGNIEIAQDFKQILLVPADREARKPETFVRQAVENVRFAGVDFRQEAREEFIKLLKDKSKVIIKNSRFTKRDVGVLTEAIIKKMNSKGEKQ